VGGCLEWRRYGLKEPKCVAIATDEYREEMNVFTEFLDDECILGASLEDTVENLYRSYTAWCTRHNEQHMTKKSFGASLKESGYQSSRLDGKRSWKGLALKPRFVS